MSLRYHVLGESSDRTASRRQELTEAEEELLSLLKERGVASICASISKEIHYVWAVASGFRTLSNVGNFYFACGAQTFGYNPARDFFRSQGLQLALFALKKFVHNEHVLVPTLDCIAIFCKLEVESAIEFLAVEDAKELVMKCVRFHDNKHDVISAACQALGSLVLNDLVKEALSTPELVRELLGLVKRYGSVQAICRSAIAPLGFLVTDANMTAVFVDGNGIALSMGAMKLFQSDGELVWHVIGLLNGLNAKVLDPFMIIGIFDGTGVHRIVEALASHLDTEEIAVEGFQLLSRLANYAPTAINSSRVLDLALLALFAYSGQQHRHTRREIKATLPNFYKCALLDPIELARRERTGGAGKTTFILFSLLAVCLLLVTIFSSYDTEAANVKQSVKRIVEADTAWWSRGGGTTGPIQLRRLRDVKTVDDMWTYLGDPFYNALLAPDTAQTDNMVLVDRTHVLLGGVQLRRIRASGVTCPLVFDENNTTTTDECFPPFSYLNSAPRINDVIGTLAVYPENVGDRRFLPVARPSSASTTSTDCNARCILEELRSTNWFDYRSSRALVVNFNMYTPAADVHCRVQLLFELASTGGAILASSAQVSPLRFRLYRSPIEKWAPTLASELALVSCIIWFTWTQIIKVIRYRWLYFIIRRHVLDATIAALGLAAIASRLQVLTASSFKLRRLLATSSSSSSDGYIELMENVHLMRVERVILACFSVLVWWRFIRVACRGLKSMESAFDRISVMRRSANLEVVGCVMAFAVVGAAHAAVIVDMDASGGLQRDLGAMILEMASIAVQRWHRQDSFRGGSSFTLTQASIEVVRIFLELASLFVMISIVIAILRDRFNSSTSRTRSLDDTNASSRQVDELQLLEMAKEKLEAHGMRVHETSIARKIRAAASAGLEKIQSAVLTKADDSLELLDLRRAWGLPALSTDDDSTSSHSSVESTAVSTATKCKKLARVPATRLYAVEEREREVEQRLSEMALRVRGVVMHLEEFRQVVQEEMMVSDSNVVDTFSDTLNNESTELLEAGTRNAGAPMSSANEE